MDNIDKILSVSLDRYFNTLSTFGYKNYCDVSKLLVLMFIESILYNKAGILLPEKDYKEVEKALYCLYGESCLIPYPEYINNDSLEKDGRPTQLRVTEDSFLRSALNYILRAALV